MRSRLLLLPILGSTLVVGCLVAFIYTQVADTLRVDERGVLRRPVRQVGEEIASTAKSLTASAEMAAHLPDQR